MGANTKHTHRRGGPRPGAGRKPLAAGEHSTPFNVRLTATQRAKLARLGGAAWLRARIDRAREPHDF